MRLGPAHHNAFEPDLSRLPEDRRRIHSGDSSVSYMKYLPEKEQVRSYGGNIQSVITEYKVCICSVRNLPFSRQGSRLKINFISPTSNGKCVSENSVRVCGIRKIVQL